MAASLTIQANAVGATTKEVENAEVTADIAVKKSHEFTSGTGADQVDKIATQKMTGVTTTGTTLDVAGGITDGHGDTVTLARIKALHIVASAANTANVVVGGATNAVAIFGAAAHTISIPPGGSFTWVAPQATGVAVSGGSSDELKIAAASGTVACDVVIAGASA